MSTTSAPCLHPAIFNPTSSPTLSALHQAQQRLAVLEQTVERVDERLLGMTWGSQEQRTEAVVWELRLRPYLRTIPALQHQIAQLEARALAEGHILQIANRHDEKECWASSRVQRSWKQVATTTMSSSSSDASMVTVTTPSAATPDSTAELLPIPAPTANAAGEMKNRMSRLKRLVRWGGKS